MFLAHSIRLRDPWQCAATEQGGVCWSRRFHRPTGLEADDQLLLVVSGLPAGAAVRVNGCTFSGQQSAISDQPEKVGDGQLVAPQFDLTSILADANEIEIEIPHDPLRRLVEPRLGNSFPYDARLAVMGNS
ncbi:hypothetical protein [Lacipirellula parvula]|uniref:Uncharacterized protein n=1 Tax=Lacipirellula parvula TaxID=2650471 RepID=A0A5K7XDC9_9BACT|nr:hypothetical protein [Lacipirellula parvula]BBO34037.1 hypothetical protein PLANPX_3649 [Lacipirellula parvula]